MPHPHYSRTLRLIACAALIGGSSAAWANGTGGCDLRQLSLSPAQQEQLRRLRAEYRHRAESLNAQIRSARQLSDAGPAVVLAHPVFDENLARHYVNSKNSLQIQREIESLRAQHALFQVLTPQQRQEWLLHCMPR